MQYSEGPNAEQQEGEMQIDLTSGNTYACKLLVQHHKEATRLSTDSCDGASFNPWSAGQKIIFFFLSIFIYTPNRYQIYIKNDFFSMYQIQNVCAQMCHKYGSVQYYM